MTDHAYQVLSGSLLSHCTLIQEALSMITGYEDKEVDKHIMWNGIYVSSNLQVSYYCRFHVIWWHAKTSLKMVIYIELLVTR
jgi:hypothetical protein